MKWIEGFSITRKGILYSIGILIVLFCVYLVIEANRSYDENTPSSTMLMEEDENYGTVSIGFTVIGSETNVSSSTTRVTAFLAHDGDMGKNKPILIDTQYADANGYVLFRKLQPNSTSRLDNYYVFVADEIIFSNPCILKQSGHLSQIFSQAGHYDGKNIILRPVSAPYSGCDQKPPENHYNPYENDNYTKYISLEDTERGIIQATLASGVSIKKNLDKNKDYDYELLDGRGGLTSDFIAQGDLNDDGLEDAVVEGLWCAASCGSDFIIILSTNSDNVISQEIKDIPEIQTVGAGRPTIKGLEIKAGIIFITFEAQDGTSKKQIFAYKLIPEAGNKKYYLVRTYENISLEGSEQIF